MVVLEAWSPAGRVEDRLQCAREVDEGVAHEEESARAREFIRTLERLGFFEAFRWRLCSGGV